MLLYLSKKHTKKKRGNHGTIDLPHRDLTEKVQNTSSDVGWLVGGRPPLVELPKPVQESRVVSSRDLRHVNVV